MSVRSDYPELVRISNGMGVHILEDAEDQARRALDELARLRAAADEPDPRFRGHEAYITFDHEADREPDLERKPWQLVIPSPDGRAYERRAWTPEPLVHAAIKWGSDRGIGITVIVVRGLRDRALVVVTCDATYGLTDSPANPDALLAMNIAGLTEACRVARRVVLLKSMDFVTGGELHPHTRHLEHHAEQLGWAVYERLVHLPTGGRPQPATSPCRRCGGTGHQRLRVHPVCEHCAGRGDIVRRQLRARRRPSTLTILVPRHLRRGAA